MKLIDINPREWAQNTVYAGGPFAGLSNKVEPGPAVYTEGFVPGAKIAAEHDNWLHNQRTEQQRALAFSRLTDSVSWALPSASNVVLRGSLGYDTRKRLWAGILSIGGVFYWMLFDRDLKPFVAVAAGLAGAATAFGGSNRVDVAYTSRNNGKFLAVGGGGYWEMHNPETPTAVATGTLVGGQLWSASSTSSFTTRAGTAIFVSSNAAGTIASVERHDGVSFTRVALPVSVAPTDAKFYQEDGGRLWLFIGTRAMYSTNDGQAWTATTAGSISLQNTVYDPVEGVWVTTVPALSSMTVQISAYATPGVTPTVFATYPTFAVRTVRQIGRYAVGLATRAIPLASGASTAEMIMLSSDYGRSWVAGPTVSVRPGTGGFPAMDTAETSPTTARITVSEDGWAAAIDRAGGANPFAQLYGCRGISQAEGFART